MSELQELKPAQGLTPVDEEGLQLAAERAQGRLVCWTIMGGIGTSSLQQTLDIGVVSLCELSRIAAWKGASAKFIAVAEAAGYSQEICGYHKVMMGYALLLARGQLDIVPEFPTVPRPDFVWMHTGCRANIWAGEAIGRILDVPVLGADLPFEYDVADREENLDYVESQLREALDVMETWVGWPLDWPRLAEHIRGLAEVVAMRDEVHQMYKTCRPSVCSALDLQSASYAYRSAPVEEGKRIYRALREQIQGKIERGERDVPDERIRIAWAGGALPWGKTGAIRDLLARYGATLCSSASIVGSPTERGVGLDPGNPLRSVASAHQVWPTNQSIDARIEEWAKPCIEGYDVDGIIVNRMRTCKITSIPLWVWAERVEEELGVPTLIVESDGVDPAFYDQTQVENRIESFLERIADRKAGVLV